MIQNLEGIANILNFAWMSQETNESIKKKTRFSEYPEVYMYSHEKKNQLSQNDSLLLDEDTISQENLNLFASKNNTSNNYSKMPFEQVKQSQANDFAKGLQEIKQLLRQNESQQLPQQKPIVQKAQIICSKSRKSIKRFSIVDLLKHQNQNTPGRETMDIQGADNLQSRAKNLNDDEISNNKRKKQQLEQSLKKKPIKDIIDEDLKKNQRVTLATDDILKLMETYGKNQQNLGIMKANQRVTMNLFQLSKLFEMENIRQVEPNNQKGNQSTPNYSKKKSLGKSSRIKEIFSENKTLDSEKFLLDIPMLLQKCHTDMVKQTERLKSIQAENNKILCKINLAQQQLQVVKSQKKDIYSKIQRVRSNNNLLRYQNSQNIIKDVQEKYNIKIQKFVNKTEENIIQFYGQFIVDDDIFIKIRKQKHRQNAQLRIMRSILGEKNKSCLNLFQTQSILKILKNSFARNHEKKTNLLEIINSVSQDYQNLKIIDVSLEYLLLNFQLQGLEMNSLMTRLTFKINLLQNITFVFEIDLLKINKISQVIQVYNLVNHQYEHFDLHETKTENPLYNFMHLLIDKYCPV